MNTATGAAAASDAFLNGVCRHELSRNNDQGLISFLNGVCRHERITVGMPR